MHNKKKVGRPSKRTPELDQELLERLQTGETLHDICKSEHMPDRATVNAWRRKDPEFHAEYMRAREAGMEWMADELLRISDDAARDGTDSDAVARARLRVDTRKFLMAKIAPRLFGDRTQHEITGANGGAIETRDVTDPGEVARKVVLLLAQHLKAGGGEAGA